MKTEPEVTVPPSATDIRPATEAATGSTAASVALPGYEILGELGRGGMGVVFRARHVALNRPTALKMVLGSGKADSKEIIRFFAEAEAVAAVVHPHVVGVYEFGEADGRPFLALELCPGGSLAEKLKAGRLAAAAAATLIRKVADGVAAAHALGIVHRDLKPGNVLFDDRGEPKVTDFGLAKKGAGANLTQSQVVMGTPAYMSPEQAKGETKFVGPQADVWSLGVILYECLAGTRPFAAADAWALLQQVMNAEPTGLRSASRDVPRDLDLICRKCLTKAPHERYPTANELADDLGRFLTGQPILARPAGMVERSWKWVKRNKPATVAFLALAGGFTGTTLGYFRAEQARSNEAAQLAIATDQRARAEKARDRTRAVLDAMISEVTGDSLAAQKVIGEEQKKFLQSVLGYYKEFAGEQSDDERSGKRTAAAAWKVGLIEGRLGQKQESATAFRIARDGYAALAAAFPAVPEYRQNLAASHNNLGNQLADLGKQVEAVREYRKAVAIQAILAADFRTVPTYPMELAASHFNLANQLADLGKRVEAEEQYRKALAIQEKLAADFPAVPAYRSDRAASLSALGLLLKGLGKQVEAEAVHRKAQAIQDNLVAEFPAVPVYRQDLAQSHNNLGILLKVTGKRVEAEAEYRKALAIKERLAAEFPAVPAYRQGLATSRNNLGLLLADLGKRAEAEAEYRKALANQARLTADFPAEPAYRQELARSHNNLGIVLANLETRAATEAEFRKALAIREKLAADFPAVPEYRQDLATSHNNLGALLADLGKRTEAEEQYRQALAIYEKLAADFPAIPDFQLEIARNHFNFACLWAIASTKEAGKKQEYADRAMEMLHKAVQAGWKDVAPMAKDTDLDPLRERADFKQLLDSMPKPEPKK